MDAHCDYNLVDVDEFDALSIELRAQSSEALIPSVAEVKQLQLEKYPAKTHARKVKDELNVTSGLVYLDGQVEKHWEDTDGDMPFRQRRFAFYLSGANFPGTKVTYDIGQDSLILWVPVRPPSKVLWYGTIPSIKECTERFDVDSVRDIVDLKAYLENILDPKSGPPTVYVLHANERPPHLSWERPGEGVSLQPDDKSLQLAMAFARAVKTPYEISKIRRANEISSEAHREVLRHIKSLRNEAQVESIFLSKCRELGAKVQAYPPIVGSGPNAAVLHYSANDQDFGTRQLMVLDAGAEFDCYASDVTRTFPLNGKLSKEAKEVYQIVLAMQESCFSMIRPGTSWRDVQLNAVDVARKGLLNIGILKSGHAGQTPDSEAVRPFFPHGLGHLVGLDTHDVILEAVVTFGGKRHGWDSLAVEGSSAAARKLMEGMVITCEPGIYFNRAFIDDYFSTKPDLKQYVNRAMLESYYPVAGCRLEDCILVTKNGWENLTTAPKGDEMIRAINGKA